MSYTPLVIVLCGLVLVMSNELQVYTETSSEIKKSSGTDYPDLWISDLFYQPLVNFTVRNVGSTACQKQGEMYDKNLRDHINWAEKSKFLLKS